MILLDDISIAETEHRYFIQISFTKELHNKCFRKVIKILYVKYGKDFL